MEANFLYRRTGFSYSVPARDASGSVIVGQIGIGPGVPGSMITLVGEWPATFQQTRSHVFELPIVGKYYFRRDSEWQPFLGTGYSFMKAWTRSEGTSAVIEGDRAVARPLRYDMTSELNIGAIAAAGVRFRRNRIAITPELRYTRWSGYGAPGYRRNQVDLSVGITF